MRAVVQQQRKIEAVQGTEQPAIRSPALVSAAENVTGGWVDVEPTLGRVVEATRNTGKARSLWCGYQ